ncbi:hypothetical protein [Fischerella sp. NIES-3754]|nr:hypothetical protein [Fischerella sp. NIES-3754]
MTRARFLATFGDDERLRALRQRTEEARVRHLWANKERRGRRQKAEERKE